MQYKAEKISSTNDFLSPSDSSSSPVHFANVPRLYLSVHCGHLLPFNFYESPDVSCKPSSSSCKSAWIPHFLIKTCSFILTNQCSLRGLTMRKLAHNKPDASGISRKWLEKPFDLSEVEGLWRILGFAFPDKTANGRHGTPCSKLLLSAMHFILLVAKISARTFCRGWSAGPLYRKHQDSFTFN